VTAPAPHLFLSDPGQLGEKGFADPLAPAFWFHVEILHLFVFNFSLVSTETYGRQQERNDGREGKEGKGTMMGTASSKNIRRRDAHIALDDPSRLSN